MAINPQDYKKISDAVDVDISRTVEEYNDAVVLLKNNEKVIRIRVLIAFSFLEFICNLYNTYFNLGLNNRALMLKFLGDFCFTEKNQTYKNHPYLHLISVEQMYKFRNAIVHALALPEPENGISITIPNGDENSSVIKKMDEDFKKLGHTVAFISADQLMKLFIEGLTMIHPMIFIEPSKANDLDMEAMNRLNKEFARRGAKPIAMRP